MEVEPDPRLALQTLYKQTKTHATITHTSSIPLKSDVSVIKDQVTTADNITFIHRYEGK